MCGMRTGLVEPLCAPARKAVAQPVLVAENVEEADVEDASDVVLAPPLERPRAPLLPLEMPDDDSNDTKNDIEHAPVARNMSLGSLMLLTMLIAACLGLSRVSMSAGAVAFLVLVPAYIRTLSAIYYYRRRERLLSGHDIAAIYATSFVLSLMGLSAAGLVFFLMTFVMGWIAGLAGWDDPGTVVRLLSVAAAFVTVLVLVHIVWPVNED
jgi:hypothetical protein